MQICAPGHATWYVLHLQGHTTVRIGVALKVRKKALR